MASDSSVSANSDGDDSSSDDGNDPFSFETHRFSKKSKGLSDSEEDSTDDDDSVSPSMPSRSTRRNKKKLETSVDARLSALKNHKRTKVLLSIDDDGSDDSDVEVVGEKPAPTQNNVELLSSDDEDGKIYRPSDGSRVSNYTSANRDGVEVIQKARDARRALVQAQRYHGEDIRVAVAPPPGVPPNPMVMALNYEQVSPIYASTQPMIFGGQAAVMPIGTGPGIAGTSHANPSMPSKKKNLGKPVMLTLRAEESVNGRPTPTSGSNTVFSIKEHEPLQHLLNKYLKARGVSAASTKVIFKFDGQKLDLSKTPATYQLEEEDLIDVVAKTISIPTSGPAVVSSASLGPEILLTLRVHENTNGKSNESMTRDELSIRLLEPLAALLEKFKQKRKITGKRIVMTFDGMKLDMNKKPKDYDMENDDLIDVQVKD